MTNQNEAVIESILSKLRAQLHAETKDMAAADALAHFQTVRDGLESSYRKQQATGAFINPEQVEAVRRFVAWDLVFTTGELFN